MGDTDTVFIFTNIFPSQFYPRKVFPGPIAPVFHNTLFAGKWALESPSQFTVTLTSYENV